MSDFDEDEDDTGYNEAMSRMFVESGLHERGDTDRIYINGDPQLTVNNRTHLRKVMKAMLSYPEPDAKDAARSQCNWVLSLWSPIPLVGDEHELVE